MPDSPHRFSLNKLKDRLPSRNAKTKDKPSASASVPNFRLTKRLRTLGRSQSFRSKSSESDSSLVSGDGRLISSGSGVAQDRAGSAADDADSVATGSSTAGEPPTLDTESCRTEELKVKGESDQAKDPQVDCSDMPEHTLVGDCQQEDNAATAPRSPAPILPPAQSALGIDLAFVQPQSDDQQTSPGEARIAWPMLLSSITTESLYSQNSALFEASPEQDHGLMSPLDDAILATLEELDAGALDLALRVDSTDQTLGTIYEEDGATATFALRTVPRGHLEDSQLLSAERAYYSCSSPIGQGNASPLSAPLSPYPVTRAPTNSPASGLNTPVEMYSLPSISSLLEREFGTTSAEADKEQGVVVAACYVKTLPPLVQLAAYVAQGPTIVPSCCSDRIVRSLSCNILNEVD